MIETKLAQIAASIPNNNEGKILRQPENSFEKVNAVTTRGGKSTHDPSNPNNKIGKAQGGRTFISNKNPKRLRRRGNDIAGLR
jgi:hypothetical protein